MSAQLEAKTDEQTENVTEQPSEPETSPSLPEIPPTDLDFDISAFIGPSHSTEEKVQKRASNVLKLSQENEKLKAELKSMTDRLEAAERRQRELRMKEQKIMEPPSS